MWFSWDKQPIAPNSTHTHTHTYFLVTDRASVWFNHHPLLGPVFRKGDPPPQTTESQSWLVWACPSCLSPFDNDWFRMDMPAILGQWDLRKSHLGKSSQYSKGKELLLQLVFQGEQPPGMLCFQSIGRPWAFCHSSSDHHFSGIKDPGIKPQVPLLKPESTSRLSDSLSYSTLSHLYL